MCDKNDCKYGMECFKVGCYFKHPIGWTPKKKNCNFGIKCNKCTCPFIHPSNWTFNLVKETDKRPVQIHPTQKRNDKKVRFNEVVYVKYYIKDYAKIEDYVKSEVKSEVIDKFMRGSIEDFFARFSPMKEGDPRKTVRVR
jgi:hypothetical protein